MIAMPTSLLKAKWRRGARITEPLVHELIDACANHVGPVETFIAPGGTNINWIRSGNTYSIWTSGEVTTQFEVPISPPLLVATPEEIPPLKYYKGDPRVCQVFGVSG